MTAVPSLGALLQVNARFPPKRVCVKQRQPMRGRKPLRQPAQEKLHLSAEGILPNGQRAGTSGGAISLIAMGQGRGWALGLLPPKATEGSSPRAGLAEARRGCRGLRRPSR